MTGRRQKSPRVSRLPQGDAAQSRRLLAVGALLLAGALAAPGADTDTPAVDASAAAPELEAPFAEQSQSDRARESADNVWLQTLADDAVEAGFYSVAEGFYRKALASAEIPDALRRRLTLGLVTALIAQSKEEEAATALVTIDGEHGPAWLVRDAALYFLRSDFEQLEARLDEIDPNSLVPADAGWYHFLRAMDHEHRGDQSDADGEFAQALALTTSTAQVAVFSLAQKQAKIVAGEATEGLAAQVRRIMDENAGVRIGFQAGLRYAVILQTLGRPREAIEVLTRQKSLLPPSESELRDETLLMLGLIAGANSTEGRAAFRELLVSGSNREWQQAALLRLAAGVPAEGGPATAGLRQLYDELLNRKPAHPLYEALLFYRAELELRNGDFVRAEEDIDSLLKFYPGTELRRNALALLASSSWQSSRFRNAANYITQLRASSDSDPERAALAVLLGECYYRAGLQTGTAEDFRNAAQAYEDAQNELADASTDEAATVGVSKGTLFFQRVLATIRSGDPDRAAQLLDDPQLRQGVDSESRWQAEWNLVRFLQLQGREADAFNRVEGFSLAPGIPADLRLRFLWLSAQLSLDVGLPSDTADRVARVQTFVQSDEAASIDEDLRLQVASNAALLGAQAQFAQGDTDGGMKALQDLRDTYRGSRAALYSFIVQARYLATENQLVDAQRLLTNLADTYPNSEYAPMALYEAALQAERRGQDAYLTEASQLLERLATEYPDEKYQFPARLKQADISRRLNLFPAAEQIYEYLENTFPANPDRAYVELSLADTLMAQSASDPAKFEGAITRLERLAVLPTAEPDLRAEAGFKLAYAWQVQGNAERASQLYWEVYERFLGSGSRSGALGARGRYWLSRTLFELAQLEENASRLDNARRAYEAVISHGLPGEKLARGRLGRFQTRG